MLLLSGAGYYQLSLGHLDLASWWPVFLIIASAIWGGFRVLYLRARESVKVLSFISRPRTMPENGLAIVALALGIYLIVRPLVPALDEKLYTVHVLPQAIGLLVMTAGILFMMLAQAQMGTAWRIGVPANREDGQSLVTDGLFRISRNPVYVGIMGFIAGAVLLLPGPITIISLLVSGILIGKLIRSEEIFMQATFGAEYTVYCSRVRRWL